MIRALQAAEKTPFFEGYGLQPVHKRLKTGAALAAEGRIFIRLPTFSAASLAAATVKSAEIPMENFAGTKAPLSSGPLRHE